MQRSFSPMPEARACRDYAQVLRRVRLAAARPLLGLLLLRPGPGGDGKRGQRPQPAGQDGRAGSIAARSPMARCVHLRAEGDQVCQLRDRLEVAERGQPRQTERIEVVAREQPQVVVGGSETMREPP